jgi:hypothetical protein
MDSNHRPADFLAMKENSQLIFQDGNVILYTRDRSKYYQARIKLQNNKWKRISTGETDLKIASSIACQKYDEIKVLKKRKIAIDTRKFKGVAEIAIREMQEELDAGYGKKIFIDYIQALNNYFIPYFKNHNIDNIDYKRLKEFNEWRIKKSKEFLKSFLIFYFSNITK